MRNQADIDAGNTLVNIATVKTRKRRSLKPIQRNASRSGTKLNDHENTSRRPKPSDDTGHNQLRSSGSKHRKPKPNERSVSDTLPNGTIGTLVKTTKVSRTTTS
ncbi:hypothetical protein [Lacihabitans lacunae]|uniref:Uncharacterized protein n=1 Tax=Lacihabitans lacunae TaxID=1028214 RepID=A0ABV7YT81_9BACT